MKTYDPSQIRNVALVGHGNTGKTALVSALLYRAGAVNRLGKVDDGTATTDFEPEEQDKKISLQCALAHLEWKRTKVNLLDTPGYGNFISDAKLAIRVADGALLLIDAVSGVEVQTETVWRFLEQYELPRLIVVNRMDRERASHERTLESLNKKFGRKIVPLQIPLGEEKAFAGVVDLITLKAYRYDPENDSGKPSVEDPPAELAEEAAEARKALMEMVAEGDDELMERYLENEELSPEEFAQGLTRAVASRELYPLVYTAATQNFGSDPLLDAMVTLLPSPTASPAARGKDASGEELELEANTDAPLSAFVFKTLADPFTGKISLIRIYSGKLGAGDALYNSTKEAPERFTTLAFMQGKAQTAVETAQAGDIVAIPKLKETLTNDTLCTKDTPILYPEVSFPEPAISFAIQPKTHGDEDKIGQALARIAEADPTLRVAREAQTHELLVSGMGENHIEVVVGKLHTKFGVEVTLKPPKVPYRETIKKKVEVAARHKKQTGGRGQFADVTIRMEPLARGGDFEFADKIFGGVIPQGLRPAVEKGIQEARLKGFLAGFPVVDFKVTLTDGGFHPVDSSEMAFKIAGAQAFKKGMADANAVLLEPIMQVRVDAPEENMGDIIGDLNSRRGRIQGMEGGRVDAQAPMAEMLSYAPTLKSITGGRGTYHMEFDHYDEVPSQVAQKVIEEAAKVKGDEAEAS